MGKRELMDDDGENLAVRTFLQLYGQPGVTVGRMKKHLSATGFDGCWPDWVWDAFENEHLTKGGAQHWIRHLFGLESAERSAQEADAARYRWLRHGDNDELVIQKGPVDQTYHWLPRNERLDAMIDAHIAAISAKENSGE